ncbi:MAG: alkaline phosphatase family protein [Bacteroidota bacterium]
MTPEKIRRASTVILALLVCALAAAAVPAAASPGQGGRTTVVLVVLDGCPARSVDALPPEAYIRQLAAEGCFRPVRTVFPSSTAAGHAALLTGKWPDENGVTGKEFMREDGTLGAFNSSRLIEAPTLMERAAMAGSRTAVISGKNGVRSLLGEGVDLAASPGQVPQWVLEKVGPPPAESAQYDDFCAWYEGLDRWVIDVASAFVKDAGPGALVVANLAGPDKVGHRFGPVPAPETTHCLVSAGKALEALAAVLEGVAGDDWALVVTADHGMTPVTRAILPRDILEAAGAGDCVFSLDGGVMCAWPTADRLDAVMTALRNAEGVAEVIGPGDAARVRVHATHRRSAPVIAIASAGYMFIESAAFMDYTKGSHGTLLESDVVVPLIVCGPRAARADIATARYTVDIAGMLARLLGIEK